MRHSESARPPAAALQAPAMPRPGRLAEDHRRGGTAGLRPGPWPAITQPGHADRRAAIEPEALHDLLLALQQRAWPLQLEWPGAAGWHRLPTTLTQVLPVLGGWWLQWRDGALLLPDTLCHQVWRLQHQRRQGPVEHLLVADARARPVLLLSVMATGPATACGWPCLLDELAPWPQVAPALNGALQPCARPVPASR